MEKVLRKEILKCHTSILYKPLKGEINYTESTFPIEKTQNTYLLPPGKKSDPYKYSSQLCAEINGRKVFVLIPGTKFDKYGTRKGRGAGWYDRFLSKIPRSWIRIGVLDESIFSKTELLRKNWDEPMDWLIIKQVSDWKILKTLDPRNKID